jgi:hypothetical protein
MSLDVSAGLTTKVYRGESSGCSVGNFSIVRLIAASLLRKASHDARLHIRMYASDPTASLKSSNTNRFFISMASIEVGMSRTPLADISSRRHRDKCNINMVHPLVVVELSTLLM